MKKMIRQTNYLVFATAIIFLSIASVTILSCGSNDEEPSKFSLLYGGNEEKGVWVGVDEACVLNEKVIRTWDRSGVRWTFYKSGNFTIGYTYNTEVFNGTYKVDGSELIINFPQYWSGQTNVSKMWTIESLTESELVVKSDYPDTEYDYTITTFRKL